MDRPSVAVVIPCYNESKTIAEVVAGARRFADVIVVDDGSTDGSADLAIKAGAEVVRTEGRLGYEAVIDHGLQIAHNRGFAWIMTLDGDGEHDPECVRRMVEAAHAGNVDVVFGRRLAYARFGEAVVGRLTQRLIGVRDPLCGAKLFSHSVIDDYMRRGAFAGSNLVNTKHAFEAVAGGSSVSEVDVYGVIRTDPPRFGRTLSANFKILRIVPYIFAAALKSMLRKRR